MLKIIAVGGCPAAGKTSLMREVMKPLAFVGRLDFKYGLLNGHWYPKLGLYILGEYSSEAKLFAGTDRLSMAVQPDAEKFLVEMRIKADKEDVSILFEGDRLFNGSFLARARELADEFEALLLQCSKEESERRHKARGDTQSEQFKKSRETKYERIAERGLISCRVENETKEQQAANAAYIGRLLQREGAGQPALT